MSTPERNRFPRYGRCAALRVVALWLAPVCLIGGAACSRQTQDAGAGPVIARLSSSGGSVYHRAATGLSWTSASRGMGLRNRDAVRTEAESSAEVTFNDGSRLEIDERSLVVIQAPPDKPSGQAEPGPPLALTTRIQRGTVRGVARAHGGTITVVGPDGKTAQIAASGSGDVPFRVRLRQGGKLEVAVLSGTARLRAAGKDAVTVRPSQVVDIGARGVSSPTALLPYPELIAPAVDAEVHAPVELAWQAVSGARAYRLQVSTSLTFSSKLLDQVVQQESTLLRQFRPGARYVWRVSSIDGAGHEGEFGFARRFVAMAALPPHMPVVARMTGPRDRSRIELAHETTPVTFSWEGQAPAYELVVARRSDLREASVVVRQRSSGTKVPIQSLAQGTYYWGVFALGDKGERKALFKRPWRLVIKRRLPPKVTVPSAVRWR